MLGKRLSFLALSLLLSEILFGLGTARPVEPIPDGQQVPKERGKLPPGALTLEVQCWKQNEVKEFLIFAINQGAPLFNEGDHYGCHRIYDFAARRIMWVSGHCPDRPELAQAAKVLQAAQERAEAAPTAKEKAWALRKAFDMILQVPEPRKSRL